MKTTVEKQLELKDNLMRGLEKVYVKLIAFKKQKNTELVVMKDGRISRISPGKDI